VAIVACEEPPSGGGAGAPTGGQVVAGYPDYQSCLSSAGPDTDLDGVNDGCELTVARAFAPLLSMSMGEDDYESWRGLIGGEYYYGVTKSNVWLGLPGLRIAYLPAYYLDLGTGTLSDYIAGGGHAGDSEFIMVDVVPFGGKWVFVRAFLSAHCTATFGPLSTQPDCQWWNSDMFPLFVDFTPNGAPWVFVSNRKHANYYSYTKCDGAQYGKETCFGSRVLTRFPVDYGFNVGSSSRDMIGIIGPRRGSPLAQAAGRENFWSSGPLLGFNGWQTSYSLTDQPTPYGKILRDFGF
jgi:hypothetical protein